MLMYVTTLHFSNFTFFDLEQILNFLILPIFNRAEKN